MTAFLEFNEPQDQINCHVSFNNHYIPEIQMENFRLGMIKSTFFNDALGDNTAGVALNAERLIVSECSGKAVVACRDLDVQQFARLELCELAPDIVPKSDSYRYWGGEDYDRLYTSYNQVVWQVRWNDHSLQVVHLEWETGCGGGARDWVIADAVETAEAFILEVERRTHAPGDAILVFSDGHWQRSHSLFAATQEASFDDLVLADDMKESLRSDFAQFLESEDRYKRLGIAWRRGALMIGPPGNGKTHCVRALIKELAISSLYVQSLSHNYYTQQQMWQRVFERARGLTPCVLVLEDLDTLVDDDNRSFFLNQLDGFDQNHGLIVLATTNYPDRIDRAIIDRPSRFDRKYHFGLPTHPERGEYLSTWQTRIGDETGWQIEEIDAMASATEGFSFAYLKELVVSSVMNWMGRDHMDFADTMKSQAALLQRQMATEVQGETNRKPQSRRARQRA